MRYRPSGRAVVIALWRANIKPPLEVVVDNLKIADILGVTLNFEIDGKQRIVLDINDVREHTENQDN